MATEDNKSGARRKCAGCGAELTGATPAELCPKCLLKLAMKTEPGPGSEPDPGRTATNVRGLPQPGEQLGRYAILRALGAGGMGAVYEAQDTESGRRVALKVLSQSLDSPESRERFFREGRLAASINHPNSVYIFGTEEIGGTPVIAMELVAGGTLQDRVKDQGPLRIGEAVDCVLQIVEGLEAAQRIGILHRDIKPSNCYVGEDGTVKIGDFGLSISTTVRTEPSLTATGAFLGTPAFSSPEQLRGDELTARSDMYSVGATLYYLLTGRTPFEAANMVQLLATVLERRAPSPTEFRSEIPRGLAKAVLRCLEKEPGERFKSYADLVRALAPYSSAAPTPATLGLRFLAGVIDMTVLSLAGFVLMLLVYGSPTAFMDVAMQGSPRMAFQALGWSSVAFIYYALCEGLWGAAVGKAICRLRVVGSDRNAPGVGRALLRALVFFLPPTLPYWGTLGLNARFYLGTSTLVQTLLGLLVYTIMALMFVTARRRNGFAAIQDLISRTRVISRVGVMSPRPAHSASELALPSIESAATIGPYHVLQGISETAGVKWFLAYDLKLLRRVWVRQVPLGTDTIAPPLRNLSRVGRLRWLTGTRSATENWDAFEALTGGPLLERSQRRQPWSEVRFWLHDLAVEIAAAEKDGTLPPLALDRIWITEEGRAKLLDFTAPGLAAKPELQTPAAGSSPGPPPQTPSQLLAEVAATALGGTTPASAQPAGGVAAPLPLHARAFLERLPQMPGADTVAAALQPLLRRVAVVSRQRRAALVAGCMLVPALASVAGWLGMSTMREFSAKNPEVLGLSTLLQTRSSVRFWNSDKMQFPDDQQVAVYVAHHYRNVITNPAAWSSGMALALIKGDARKFAEKSLVEYPAPTAAEIQAADAAVLKFVPGQQAIVETPPWLPVVVVAGGLILYVCLPAIIAALLFRGGLVLLIAGVTFVRADGQPASRLRVFWRALVAWSPILFVFVGMCAAVVAQAIWAVWAALALFCLLAAISVALPTRALQDRLAGTWPVPR
jgi:eukaryotic-like serine/threonine-protein kinase